MSDYDYLHSGEWYLPGDAELAAFQRTKMMNMHLFNQTAPNELDKRSALLQEMLAEAGEGCFVEPPFHANWGGAHLHLGKNVYVNFGLTVVDDTHIYIGDNTMLGPNVVLATATHPTDPELRRQGLQANKAVRIGQNCWLGAGVMVMPGVTIGDDTVIGAGSVVTKDIPSGVVAAGNPCRVIRNEKAEK